MKVLLSARFVPVVHGRDKLTIADIAGHQVASNETEQKAEASSEAVAFW